jgi:hypothetical protein
MCLCLLEINCFQVNTFGVHVIIDLSSHLSPVIQSVLLHRPSIVQVQSCFRSRHPLTITIITTIMIADTAAATSLRSITSAGWPPQAPLGSTIFSLIRCLRAFVTVLNFAPCPLPAMFFTTLQSA